MYFHRLDLFQCFVLILIITTLINLKYLFLPLEVGERMSLGFFPLMVKYAVGNIFFCS